MNPETLLERYRAARTKVVEAQAKAIYEDRRSKITRVYQECSIIESVGGEKALGSNETERKRNLERHLCNDKDYRTSVSDAETAQQMLGEAEAELDCIKFEMRLYEASLKDREVGHV